jgi:hypothetical protein
LSLAAHPARSLDFLSRLHDGELTAAERAHFESHRAHCDECRRAAADFEATLDYYRTSGTPAARPDLAARILRRLETANPRRRPFGVVFGIDLKWAGAFMAALVVTILGYSLLDRRKEREQIRVSFSGPASATTRLASAPAEPAPPPKASRDDLEKRLGGSQIAGQLAKPDAPPAATPPPKAAPGSVSQLLASEKKEKVAPAPADKMLQAAPASAPARSPAAASRDEGGAPAAEEKDRRARESHQPVVDSAAAVAAAPPVPAPVRLTVRALDDLGEPPAVLNVSEIGIRPEDRGRYVVTVGADGVALEVRREEPRREDPGEARNTSGIATLQKLRFAAADRPRRLLVAVE